MSLPEGRLLFILLTRSSEAIIQPTNAPLYCSCDCLAPSSGKTIGREDFFDASSPINGPTTRSYTSCWPSSKLFNTSSISFDGVLVRKEHTSFGVKNTKEGYLMHIEDR